MREVQMLSLSYLLKVPEVILGRVWIQSQIYHTPGLPLNQYATLCTASTSHYLANGRFELEWSLILQFYFISHTQKCCHLFSLKFNFYTKSQELIYTNRIHWRQLTTGQCIKMYIHTETTCHVRVVKHQIRHLSYYFIIHITHIMNYLLLKIINLNTN